MGTVESITLTTGAAWASGINLYATLLMLGYLVSTGGNYSPSGPRNRRDPKLMAVAPLGFFRVEKQKAWFLLSSMLQALVFEAYEAPPYATGIS